MPGLKFVQVCDKQKWFVVNKYKCFKTKTCLSNYLVFTTMIQGDFVLAAIDICINCMLPQLTTGAKLKLLTKK